MIKKIALCGAAVAALAVGAVPAFSAQHRAAAAHPATAAQPAPAKPAFGTWGFDIGVLPDLKENTHYSAYLSQGGLGLPDRDYYTDQTNPKFAEARAKYKVHVANMLRLAGIADPEGKAQRIFDLESKIAESHWTR